MSKNPEEILELISPQSIEGTPMELMRQAMIKHFEDDREFQNEFRMFMSELKPYMQGAAGLGALWKFLIAIGGILVIWAQIKGLFGK